MAWAGWGLYGGFVFLLFTGALLILLMSALFHPTEWFPRSTGVFFLAVAIFGGGSAVFGWLLLRNYRDYLARNHEDTAADEENEDAFHGQWRTKPIDEPPEAG